MSDSWDEYADGWDSDPDVILYSEKVWRSLQGLIDPTDMRVLDFGCGSGLLTAKLASVADRVLALDSSATMISVLQNKQLSNVDTLTCQLSAESIRTHALLDSEFDLIVASSVCAFVPDYIATLQLLKSLLKPGGTLLQWDWARSQKNPDFGFSAEDIESAFGDAGLETLSVSAAFSLVSKKGSMQVLMGVARNSVAAESLQE